MTVCVIAWLYRRSRAFTVLLRKLTSGLFLLLLVGLVACDSTRDEQEAFEREALAPPQGITETDGTGAVLSTDPDDWRLGPRFPPPAVHIKPAYPNPVHSGEIILEINFGFDIEFRGLFLALYNPATDQLVRPPIASLPDARGVGPQTFTFSAGALGRTGLSRVVVYTGQGEILTYGDIRVES